MTTFGVGFGCCPFCRARPRTATVTCPDEHHVSVTWGRGRSRRTFDVGALCDACEVDVLNLLRDADPAGEAFQNTITVDWNALAEQALGL